MRRRIYIELVMVAGTAIFATLLLATVVYYKVFERQVFEDLKICAKLLAGMGWDGANETEDGADFEMWAGQELRITLIGQNGTVFYDTAAKGEFLENHGSRKEVMEALEKGESKVVRDSPTFHKNTFYFALRLDENTVLRTAREADSILGIFTGVLPVAFFLAMLLFALCMLLSHVLTRRLIAPVERLAKEGGLAEEVDTYRELQPLLQTIRRQHGDILKSARMRQDFTANVSHELKTPLACIQGYAELIENGMAKKEDAARFAGEIRSSSIRLLALINDILRLSELDEQKGNLECEPVELSELARTCVEMLSLNAKKQGVSLMFSGGACVIEANRGMLEELLYNLVDNAVRYNQSGGQVFVGVTESGEQVCLAVKDTGIGIGKEHQERIFERFYRVDKSRSRATGGTGLGLAIVKHIADCHGARIELESEVGNGTKIQIYFSKKICK